MQLIKVIMKTKHITVTLADHEKILKWSRQATFETNKPVTVADIIAALLCDHVGRNGDVPPRQNCTNAPDENKGL